MRQLPSAKPVMHTAMKTRVMAIPWRGGDGGGTNFAGCSHGDEPHALGFTLHSAIHLPCDAPLHTVLLQEGQVTGGGFGITSQFRLELTNFCLCDLKVESCCLREHLTSFLLPVPLRIVENPCG